jgi:hypothetical protein
MGFINSLLAGGCKSMNYYNKKMRVNDEVNKNLYTASCFDCLYPELTFIYTQTAVPKDPVCIFFLFLIHDHK